MNGNYPPGVSGNEPQITGIWPAETVIDSLVSELQTARDQAIEAINDALSQADDQGMRFNQIEKDHQDKLSYAIEVAFDNVIDDLEARMPEDYQS